MTKNKNSNLHFVVLSREIRIIAMMGVITLTYFIAWMPYSIMALIAASGHSRILNYTATTLPSLFAKSGTIYNPIIYITMNKQFRRQYLSVGVKYAITLIHFTVCMFIDCNLVLQNHTNNNTNK